MERTWEMAIRVESENLLSLKGHPEIYNCVNQ